jgi:hypothetical protein
MIVTLAREKRADGRSNVLYHGDRALLVMCVSWLNGAIFRGQSTLPLRAPSPQTEVLIHVALLLSHAM